MAKRKVIDEKLLQKLCQVQLSDEIIADCLNISVDTLKRRFADKMKTFRSDGKSKIAIVLFDEAINKRQGWAIKLIAERKLDYGDLKNSDNDKNFTFTLNYSKEDLKNAKQTQTKK